MKHNKCDKLPEVTFVLNTAKQSSTKASPRELVPPKCLKRQQEIATVENTSEQALENWKDNLAERKYLQVWAG